jgi:hypothetical protein
MAEKSLGAETALISAEGAAYIPPIQTRGFTTVSLKPMQLLPYFIARESMLACQRETSFPGGCF